MRVSYTEIPARFTEVAAWELRVMTDLAAMRSALHVALAASALPPDARLGAVPERLVLVASELATNALRHGTPPVVVRLLSDGRSVAVDVVDHSPESEPVIADRRAPGAGGFGLRLACRAAADVGWYRVGLGAKHVWASFEVPTHRAGASARSALLLG